MNNASQRPTGTQGPLQYAPRRIRETQQPRDASTTLPANTVPSRVDEVEAESDDALPDRPLPWRGLRAPPVQLVPPPPQSERRTFATMREIALLSVVAVLSAILVVTLYPRKLETDATNTPARTLPVTAQTPGSVASEATRAIPPAPRVAVNESPTPVQSEQRASPGQATAAAAVAPLHPPDLPFRGITDTEIRFGIAAPFSGSAKELGRQMKLGIDTMFSAINAGGGINGRKVRLIAADDGYEPSRTADAMKQLFEKDEVFGIVGNVGTPTAIGRAAVRPRAEDAVLWGIHRRGSAATRSARPLCLQLPGKLRGGDGRDGAIPREGAPAATRTDRRFRPAGRLRRRGLLRRGQGRARVAGRRGEHDSASRLQAQYRGCERCGRATAPAQDANQSGSHGADVPGSRQIHRKDARPLPGNDLHQCFLRGQHRTGRGAEAFGTQVYRRSHRDTGSAGDRGLLVVDPRVQGRACEVFPRRGAGLRVARGLYCRWPIG